MTNPFVTLFLWELGSIVFLAIEIYRTFHESLSLRNEIDKYNDEGKLNSSSKAAREIALKNLISGLWFGSVSVCILNSVVIAFEILDPFIAVISGVIPFSCWLISNRFRGKVEQIKIQRSKRFGDKTRVFIYNNLVYIAISMVLGQMVYFAAQFSNERGQMIFTISELLPIAIGLVIGVLALNIGERIVPYTLKSKN